MTLDPKDRLTAIEAAKARAGSPNEVITVLRLSVSHG
jgi:hypothetical protein